MSFGSFCHHFSYSRTRHILEYAVLSIFDGLGNNSRYVVFNIRHNRYRLLTMIHYSREKEGRITEGHIYLRSFLTHKQYETKANWNKGGK